MSASAKDSGPCGVCFVVACHLALSWKGEFGPSESESVMFGDKGLDRMKAGKSPRSPGSGMDVG